MQFFEKLNSPIAVVVVVVLFLAVDGFLLYRYPPTSSPEATEEANGVRVDVRVIEAPTWLRVQEDGQTVLAQETSVGFSRRFEADREVSIRTEDAGATWVEANGPDAGTLGDDGEVGTWTFGDGT